jgi:hypothetical protein
MQGAPVLLPFMTRHSQACTRTLLAQAAEPRAALACSDCGLLRCPLEVHELGAAWLEATTRLVQILCVPDRGEQMCQR